MCPRRGHGIVAGATDGRVTSKRVLRAATIGAAMILGGCRAALDRVFTAPTVALRGVELTGLGLQGASLDVTLSIVNPNPYPLSAARASYRLLVADSTELGRGSAATPLRVAGDDSALVRLPLDVQWSAVSRAGRRALRGGVVDYRVIGEVVANTPLGERAIPIDAGGRFSAVSGVR